MTIPLPTTGNIEAADLNDMFNAVHTELSDIVTKHSAFDADWNLSLHVSDLSSSTPAADRTLYFYAPDDAKVRCLWMSTRHTGVSSTTVTGTLASVDADDLLVPITLTDTTHTTSYGSASDFPAFAFLRKGALYSLTLVGDTAIQWVTLALTVRSMPRRV